jgi:hypothetical protein
MDKEFRSAVDEARRIEKKALGYNAYDGDITVERKLDLYPKEYADYDYTTLLNLYERTEKIIKATGMKLYGAPPKVDKKVAAKTQEVESRVKEITGDALKDAKEIGKEMKEKPIEVKPKTEIEKPKAEEIEFEALTEEAPAQEEFEFEGLVEEEEEKPDLEKEIEIPEVKEEVEIEKEEVAEKPEEEKVEEVAPKPEIPEIKKPAFVPPKLRERAEIAGSRKYDEIEERIMATLGEKVDETSLKKKMLELTKGLFKEKSFHRREQIKTEITVLKNMLKKKRLEPRKKISDKDAKGRLLETIISTQKTELASTKDKVLTEYRHQVEKLRDEFMEQITELPEDQSKEKKAAYEKFVFELTALNEKLPSVVDKYFNYVSEKHSTELEKLEGSLEKGEADVAKKTKTRIKEIMEGYRNEFESARRIVKKSIDTAIESGSRAVFKEEKPPEEEDPTRIIDEINGMDDGTLLYFLHGADPDFYKKYERKHLSKQEAIFKAKALMARDKGLSEDTISKYFSDEEG